MKSFVYIVILLLVVYPGILLAEKVPVDTKTEEVKGFSMTLVDKDGRKKAIISGSVATILPGALIEILDVVARVFDPNNKGADTLIHSNKGIYNRLTNVIDTDQFVRINRRDMVITGTGFHWEPDLAKIEIHRNVRVEYATRRETENDEVPSVSSSSPMSISSISSTSSTSGQVSDEGMAGQSLTTDNPGEEDVVTVITAEGSGKLNYEGGAVAIFKKNVEIDDKKTDLKAHLMKMFFDKETEALTKVVAYGDVRIKQPKRESFCRKATYFVDEDKIILAGNPRIVQGLDLYTAQKITIYDKGERVVFEPRAELVIFAATEHEEMTLTDTD